MGERHRLANPGHKLPMRRINGLSLRQGRRHIRGATLARPMLILSVMARRGCGMRMPAIVRVICVVRMSVVIRGNRVVIALRLGCIAMRMAVAPANAQRKLQQQHGGGQQRKQSRNESSHLIE